MNKVNEDMKNSQIDAEELEKDDMTVNPDGETKINQGKTGKKNRKTKKAEEELKALKDKYDELNNKYLRLFSDFDNFRKRTLKERIELSSTASKELITDLLPVIDDFDRALSSIDKANPAFEGLNLIQNKLGKTLKQKGLEEIDAKGQEFDTDYHEALTNIPAPNPELKGKVVDVIQKGYTLGGKVIRYARVVVGS